MKLVHSPGLLWVSSCCWDSGCKLEGLKLGGGGGFNTSDTKNLC